MPSNGTGLQGGRATDCLTMPVFQLPLTGAAAAAAHLAGDPLSRVKRVNLCVHCCCCCCFCCWCCCCCCCIPCQFTSVCASARPVVLLSAAVTRPQHTCYVSTHAILALGPCEGTTIADLELACSIAAAAAAGEGGKILAQPCQDQPLQPLAQPLAHPLLTLNFPAAQHSTA